ncbi:hypothetical protein D3C78_1255360 [compost metagenome]
MIPATSATKHLNGAFSIAPLLRLSMSFRLTSAASCPVSGGRFLATSGCSRKKGRASSIAALSAVVLNRGGSFGRVSIKSLIHSPTCRLLAVSTVRRCRLRASVAAR